MSVDTTSHDRQYLTQPASSDPGAIQIEAQAGRVVAVFVAGGDHQQPEADDVGDRMHGAAGIARIVDAGSETVGHLEPLFDLAQDQQIAVGRQPAAVEPGNDFLVLNR